MTLEVILLALESLLLLFTIGLMVMSLREGRGRDKLILEVTNATKILTRHEYFITVIDTMMDAREEVVGSITGRNPQGDDNKRIREVMYNIEKLTSAGVKVKYVLPKFQDRLHVGWLYHKAGAEICYSTCPLAHDFRYTVVDGKVALIGMPEHVGQKEATKKGFRIPSEGLAQLLRNDFYDCLRKSSTFEEYVRETIEHTGANATTLAREIGIDEQALDHIVHPPAKQDAPKAG